MNIQMKKGLLDSLVLSVVNKGDTYGYQLSTDVSKIIEVAETALYPVLRRLEMQDLLKTYSKEYNGRLRKYYTITKKGKKMLLENILELVELKNIIEMIMEDNKYE
jgi:PadR family transcriptional regulator PadR